jgi:hypothetical protein
MDHQTHSAEIMKGHKRYILWFCSTTGFDLYISMFFWDDYWSLDRCFFMLDLHLLLSAISFTGFSLRVGICQEVGLGNLGKQHQPQENNLIEISSNAMLVSLPF